jgi:small subunit ribosomal protein S1
MGKWHESDDDPLQPDEGYWQALLQQGEWARLGAAHCAGPTAARAAERRRPDGNWHGQQNLPERRGRAAAAVGFNRGGLLVSWRGLRGFVPASHLVGFPTYLGERSAARSSPGASTGLSARHRARSRKPAAGLSERAASGEAARKQQLFGEIKAGDVRDGYVTNVCDFGVFVDLGGIEGLMHISEISWGRVGHPGDVLHSGQALRVYVMSVDPNQGRVALSLKRLTPDPWASVEDRYHVGQIIEGRVTNVVNFGAFVCIEEGLEGLIHISQLAEGSFLHPRSVVREGETVRARILSIDGSQRRLALSLRELSPEREASDQAAAEHGASAGVAYDAYDSYDSGYRQSVQA